MQYIETVGYKSSARIKAKLESIAYYPFHLHNEDIEIICLLNGSAEICDSAATYDLSYGDVHIFNCKDPHKICSNDPESVILTVHIDSTYYSQYFPHLEDAYFICDTYGEANSYSLDIRPLRFQLAKLYYAYSGACRDLELESHARELLALLVSQFQQYVYEPDESKTAHIVRLQNLGRICQNYDRMYRIVDYVYDHYMEKLSLAQIADMEYLSPAHLSRYMKRTLGLTFSQLVSLTRCEMASVLLAATDKTVDQIALETGFSNRKHLALQFRKWYHKTPSQYRNSILKDLSADTKIRLRSFDYEFATVILNMYLDE